MLKKAKHHCKLDRDIKALAWVIRQKLIFYYERNTYRNVRIWELNRSFNTFATQLIVRPRSHAAVAKQMSYAAKVSNKLITSEFWRFII